MIRNHSSRNKNSINNQHMWQHFKDIQDPMLNNRHSMAAENESRSEIYDLLFRLKISYFFLFLQFKNVINAHGAVFAIANNSLFNYY